MSNIVSLKCSCGAVKGTLEVVPKSFFHVHCLCRDCQRFAKHLSNSNNILDEHGGTELLQTYPKFMKITEGKENIGGIQLNKNGLYRWHTTCCNMPMANTMNSSKIPFVGIPVTFMEFTSEKDKQDILGPVIMKAFGKYAMGKMPKDAHERFPLSFMPKILGFMIKGLVKKNYVPSPFFNGKNPIIPVTNKIQEC